MVMGGKFRVPVQQFTVDVFVPQFLQQMVTVVLLQQFWERIGSRSSLVPVAPLVEEFATLVPLVPQECTQQR